MSDDKKHPLEDLNLDHLNKEPRKILKSLTPKEAKALRERFGIELNTDKTLEEVIKQFDITRERIKQIEEKALRKLKKKKILKILIQMMTRKTLSEG